MSAAARVVGKLPPKLPGGLPFLGHAPDFNRNPVRLLRGGYERFGEIFRFTLAGQPVTVVLGAQGNELVYRGSDEQFSQREAYQFTVPIFGRGVAYDVPPEVMKEQLRLLYPALGERRMQLYAGMMEDEAVNFFDAWGERGEVDLLHAMNNLTTFIASRCLIGEEFRRNVSSEFAKLYAELEMGINLVAFIRPNLPLPAFRKRDRARVRMRELISAIVETRRASGIEGEDFLQTLMDARYSDGRALTHEEITGLLVTLVFAGQHTSAVMAAWTGILLFQHPEFLPPILEEQEAERGDGVMTLDRIRRMVLLGNAIKEAERMHPPLVVLMRKILQPFDFNGYHVPAGGLVLVSPAVTHRVPDLFADPDRYDPDRFGRDRAEDRKTPFGLSGFGGGAHRCAGQAFAYQQIKVIWSVLLDRFEMELVDPEYLPDYSTFVVGPRKPCRLRYRRRQRAAVSVPALTAV